MLWLLSAILVALWLSVVLSRYGGAGYVHLILAAAAIVAIYQLSRRRRNARQLRT
jgi:hypothetical protein